MKSDVGVAAREAKFVEAFIAHNFDAKKAFMAAELGPNGGSGRSAANTASKMLARESVQNLLSARLNEIVRKHSVTIDQVMSEMKLISFSNVLDYIDVNDDGTVTINIAKASRAQMAAVKQIKTVERVIRTNEAGEQLLTRTTILEMWDKNAALANMLKYFMMMAGAGNPDADGDTTINLIQVNMSPELAAKAYQKFIK